MYLRSIVFLGSKNDRYGGLRQPTAKFDSRLSLYKTQKGKPSRNSDFSECSLAFLRFVFEFCRPRGSKKERCFCCVARCFLQTAFAISTPVSFLCIFPSFHLVVKERQGAVPMAERYFAFPRILFPEDTSGSPPVWIYLFARNKKRPHYALWHSTAACGRRQKNRLVMTAVCLMF